MKRYQGSGALLDLLLIIIAILFVTVVAIT
jgi:hypothetical protein